MSSTTGLSIKQIGRWLTKTWIDPGQAVMSADWWRFWSTNSWREWWSRRLAWSQHQTEARRLNKAISASETHLSSTNQRLTKVNQQLGWANEVRPQQLPIKTARDETGLASVSGVALLEIRRREGKDTWVPVDLGSLHLTDRQAIFSGTKQVKFGYDNLDSQQLTDAGLYLSVSTRERSHILAGPAEKIDALITAAQAVARGESATSPFEGDAESLRVKVREVESQLDGHRSERAGLVAPSRPIFPGWVPASLLLLFMFIGAAFASPDSTPPTAIGTTTTTSELAGPTTSVVGNEPLDPTTTTTTTAPTTATIPATTVAEEEEEVPGVATASDGTLPGELTVWFFDVGQGDSTLLQGPDFTILIDAGRHNRSDVVPHLRAAAVTGLDLLVGTHPHADHIGQFPQVLQAFPVTEVWMSGDTHTTLTFERTLDAILASDAAYHEPRAGETHQIGSAQIEVVNPTRASGDIHDGSVSVRVVFGQVVFLFTGDAEVSTEQAIVRRGHDLQAQILQVGHHGSRTSSTTEFLQAVSPVVAIYSAGANNQYGHPHAEAIARLAAVGADLYGTDLNGTVRVVTDGSIFHVEVDVAGAVTPITTTTIAAPTTTGSTTGGCGPGQVDINSAGVDELQQIIHIGPVRAQEMLTLRPFRSVDDMTRINGIGPSRLADIKAQGVACVP